MLTGNVFHAEGPATVKERPAVLMLTGNVFHAEGPATVKERPAPNCAQRLLINVPCTAYFNKFSRLQSLHKVGKETASFASGVQGEVRQGPRWLRETDNVVTKLHQIFSNFSTANLNLSN